MAEKELTYTLLTRRWDKIDSDSLEDFLKEDGYQGLKKALSMKTAEVIEEVKTSKLMGRGGAGFPTGLKMQFTAGAKGDQKYVICNADEGEPGTFKDKYLIMNDPHQLVEGMAICGYAIGADKGYIYLRGEYNQCKKKLLHTFEQARKKGYLGKNILKKKFDFDIEIRSGAGSYVCGEETALMESIEGKRGRSRVKPPFPPTSGLWGKPTEINNVETLSNLPFIMLEGGKRYAEIGTENSKGTKLLCLSGDFVNRGVFEVPFGITIKEVVYGLGGGIKNDKSLKMLQLGGASGPLVDESVMDVHLDFKEFSSNQLALGSGVFIAFNQDRNLLDILLVLMEFFSHESCGKCTLCREGNHQILRLLEKLHAGQGDKHDLEMMEVISKAMQDVSLCGLGMASTTPLVSSLKYFKSDLEKYIN